MPRNEDVDDEEPAARLGLRLALIVTATVLVAIPFAILLLEVVFRGPLTRLDQRVAEQQNRADLHNSARVHVAQLVTALGSTIVLAGVALAAVIFLVVVRHRRRQSLFVAVTAILGVLTNNIIKAVVGRNRPELTHAVAHGIGKSFPSGHAMNSTIVYGSIMFIAWHTLCRRTRRLALGVHYISDVVAGIVLGVAFVLASAAAFRAWERDSAQQPSTAQN